jgi:adenine-specific DNA-methyltransferase
MELEKIFGEKDVFKNPKPHNVLAKLFDYVTTKSSTILDIFAGSGSTGHAVLLLNKEDDGHRKFILCNNNENNICKDITYQRLKTVITGKRKDGSIYSEGLPGSLKYFKVDYLSVDEQMYYEFSDELLNYIRELIELENGIDMNTSESTYILMDDEELEEFINSIRTHKKCKALYVSHDVLASTQQEQLLHKNGIEIKTIPEYYYPDTETRGSDDH